MKLILVSKEFSGTTTFIIGIMGISIKDINGISKDFGLQMFG